jgi:hypothetical protein
MLFWRKGICYPILTKVAMGWKWRQHLATGLDERHSAEFKLTI